MKPAIAILLLCSAASSAVMTGPAISTREEDIRETVFRHIFEREDIRSMRVEWDIRFYFLSVGPKSLPVVQDYASNDNDPPDAFMKRFWRHKPSVRKVSRCDVDAGAGVFFKQTRERGILFRVGEVNWISETEVEADGEYFFSGTAGLGEVYALRRIGGKWIIVGSRRKWIS